MRISIHEAEIIIHNAKKFFGQDTNVCLFGSRVDDSLKGGDIDLFIQMSDKSHLLEKKVKFISALEQALGEQKIDVVLEKDNLRLIEQEAMKKGIKLDINQIKLDKYTHECDKHLQRINEAYSDLQTLIPLSSEKYKNLTKDDVQALDQYLFRFAKLQDTLGEKIFPLILKIFEANDKPIPFLDVLNKLEKYNCINSAKEWQYLRKLRNEVAHQYDDEPEAMSQAINALVLQKQIIEEIYQKLKKCVIPR
jgi:predicted nucleotidyltransferase